MGESLARDTSPFPLPLATPEIPRWRGLEGRHGHQLSTSAGAQQRGPRGRARALWPQFLLLSNEAEHSLTGQREARGKGQGEHTLAGEHSKCWGRLAPALAAGSWSGWPSAGLLFPLARSFLVECGATRSFPFTSIPPGAADSGFPELFFL